MIQANITAVGSELFGRRRPVFRRYSPVLHTHNTWSHCYLDLDSDFVEMVLPGDHWEGVDIVIARPMVMPPGQRFVLRDSNMIMILGEVTGPPTPPKHYKWPQWVRHKQNQWRWSWASRRYRPGYYRYSS